MNFNFKPIGHVKKGFLYKAMAPRQPNLFTDEAEIHLSLDHLTQQSIQDLVGFSHLWVIFIFHKNQGWSPLVRAPRDPKSTHGVLATRAPYRPNPIGLSLVQLITIKKNIIAIRGHDLLEETPVLDIKPYIPYTDYVADPKIGWLENIKEDFEFITKDEFKEKVDWLQASGFSLWAWIEEQLRQDPFPGKTKRINKEAKGFQLSIRTWRVSYHVDEEKRLVYLQGILSGYSQKELEEKQDKYGDKELHRKFLARWSCSSY